MSASASPSPPALPPPLSQAEIEAAAETYRSRLRSGGRPPSIPSEPQDVQDDEHDEDYEDQGIEEQDLEELMEGNQTLPPAPVNNAPAPIVEDGDILTAVGRDPILPPEWGDDLTARIIQEQRNLVARLEAVGGIRPTILVGEPPTGLPEHIMIPATLSQFLDIHDTTVLSQDISQRATYPDPAFDIDVQQYLCTGGCPWLDRNLYRFSARLNLRRTIREPAPLGYHFLVVLMRPDIKTRWLQRRPLPPDDGPGTERDTPDSWVTLDHEIPARPSQDTGERILPQPDADNVLACEVSLDVDSVIVISDLLPLCSTLAIPSIPARQDTISYSNRLCLKAGPKHARTLISKIPNFNLGRAGRLSVNIVFPDAFDPTFKGMGSSQIADDILGICWDHALQPAINSVFCDGAYNSLPQSGQYEADRQAEIGGRARRAGRSFDMPSSKVEKFVLNLRRLLSATTEEALFPFRNFKFILSLAGFKLQSFTQYNDLVSFEFPWFDNLDLSLTELRPAMFLKAYVKGIRAVTQDIFSPDWLDFNAMLQQGVARLQRLATWTATPEGEDPPDLPILDGDEEDQKVHPTRRREGPSLQMTPDLSKLCDIEGCDTCGVWVDVAAEIGCSGMTTLWNHSHLFDIINTLLGRSDFFPNGEWRDGVRIDECATLPGLGGGSFADLRARLYGWNSPTPYIQIYCQEKVLTYAPFGSKPRGAQNLNAIPARSLPMRYMLDCTGDPDSKFERWVAAEHRILSEAARKWDRSFPARLEVRTGLGNLLETTCNMVIAIGRTTKSDALRQYEMEGYFRWKALRAEAIARLPATIFGRKASNPSDWTIVHSLLAAQTLVHGLHCRMFDITIERDTANMHTLYLRVEQGNDGPAFYTPRSILSISERASSASYRPFFPTGFRSFHEYFDGVSGLDYIAHESRMRPLSSAEEKYALKVKRATACPRGSDVTKLRSLIKYPISDLTSRPAIVPRFTRNPDLPMVYIRQDRGFVQLKEIVKARLAAFQSKDLVLRQQQAQELEDYLKQQDTRDYPDIVLRFARSLGLLSLFDEATRLDDLRERQQQEGRQLAIDENGRVHLYVAQESSVRGPVARPRTTGQDRLNAGGLDVYDFQRHLPATALRTTQAVRSLDVYWDVECSGDGPEMRNLKIPSILRDTCLPEAQTNDDVEDDAAYRDWLRKAESHTIPFSATSYSRPSVADTVIFILSSFQHQVLRTLPPTVRPNARHPELQGQPYVKALEEKELRVSQHVMRDSYVGLPARLTRFAATQYTADKWKRFAALFFPPTTHACTLHPGWREREVTYLAMWQGLLERVSNLPNAAAIVEELATVSSDFIQSFKMLPDLTGKIYKPLFDKIASPYPVSIWDDAEFHKETTGSIENFVPRWMTTNPGDRKSPRVRLAYTFMGESQKQYLGAWQYDVTIKQSRPNCAVLYPSPAPFEYPWMKQNHHTIISERGYMIWKENVAPDHFNPDDKTRGIGHNWWSDEHEPISCAVCRTWSMLNPPVLDFEAVERPVLDPNTYQMGDLRWGYFACIPGQMSSATRVAPTKKKKTSKEAPAAVPSRQRRRGQAVSQVARRLRGGSRASDYYL